ncbi:NADPH-dependent FMN reductase [Poronia punctata]|nr:NADPH-dependent FMN reductase [Poronia punctata]
MAAPKSVALIAMSLRPKAVGPNVAAFVQPYFEKSLGAADIKVVPVNLRDFNLPIYNENITPMMVPMYGEFQHEHSKAWSAEIAKHDGYVIVIPEYNGGMAGGTKNAIDYLWNEWQGKPLTIVSYGAHGGSRSSDQAKQVLGVGSMGLHIMETRPQLAFADPMAEVGDLLSKGEFSDASKTKWEAQADEITKAAEELKEAVLKPIEKVEAKA